METEAPATEEDEEPITTAAPKATAAATTLVTKTKAAAPVETGSSSGSVARWGQCGGSGYTGSSSCADGAECTEMNPYYSQCL